MKLGKRLKQIDSLVQASEYSHIWDCCCDHGFLGMSLLNRQAAPNIHFVDIVPELINPLTDQLNQFFPAQSTWQTHCLDSAQLPLQQYSGKQLVIIAGVGGDLTIQLIQDIVQKHPHLEIDFLLCPVRQLYELRQVLITMKMGLMSEVLVKENNHFYEILLLASTNNLSPSHKPDSQHKSVSPTGDILWRGETAEAQQVAKEYLNKTLRHYKRMQQGLNSPVVDRIVQDYEKIVIN